MEQRILENIMKQVSIESTDKVESIKKIFQKIIHKTFVEGDPEKQEIRNLLDELGTVLEGENIE